MQVYLDNCAYEIVDKQIANYLDENLFETDENQIFDFDKWALKSLYYDRIKLSEGIDPAKNNNRKEYIACHLSFQSYFFLISILCL